MEQVDIPDGWCETLIEAGPAGLGMTEISDHQGLPASQRFEAMLYPNRSLGNTGFLLLMGGIALVSGLIGAGFAMVGAWPVTGFLGLDVLLLYLAFRWNFSQSQQIDIIKLDQTGLTVRRLSPRHEEQAWHFEAAWVQVLQDDRQLWLRSHGKKLAIGTFLTADERRTFAQALRSAIQAHREGPMSREATPDDGAIG